MTSLKVTLSSSTVVLDGEIGKLTASVTNTGTVPDRVVLGVFPPVEAGVAGVQPTSPTTQPSPPAGSSTSAPATTANSAAPWTQVERPLREIASGATEQFVVTFDGKTVTPGVYEARFIAYSSTRAPEEFSDQASTVTITKKGTPTRPTTPRGLLWIVVAALLVAVLVGGVAFVLLRDGDDTPEPVATTSQTSRQVPSVIGMQQPDAEASLKTAGLRVKVETMPGVRPLGLVDSQQPAANASVERDSEVTIVVRVGLPLDNLKGQTLQAAQAKLNEQRFTDISTVDRPDLAPPGTVISQKPEPGTVSALDEPITLVVAIAPALPACATRVINLDNIGVQEVRASLQRPPSRDGEFGMNQPLVSAGVKVSNEGTHVTAEVWIHAQEANGGDTLGVGSKTITIHSAETGWRVLRVVTPTVDTWPTYHDRTWEMDGGAIAGNGPVSLYQIWGDTHGWDVEPDRSDGTRVIAHLRRVVVEEVQTSGCK